MQGKAQFGNQSLDGARSLFFEFSLSFDQDALHVEDVAFSKAHPYGPPGEAQQSQKRVPSSAEKDL